MAPATHRILPDHHPWKVTPLRAGSFRLDGGAMFGLIPRTFWSTWILPDDHNRIGLSCNCMLLQDGSRTVLVESGYGDKWSTKDREIYALESRTVVDALAEQNVAVDDVDDVIVSHLHFDHAAGLTSNAPDGSSVRTFPRARIHVQRREWLDALDNRSTMTKTYLPSHLLPIRDAMTLHDGAVQMLPGIAVRPLIGHTWGQQGVFVRTPDGVTVFPADLLPTVHHAHLSASMGYDMLPYENMINKREFLAEALGEGWTLVLDHDPATPVVRAAADPKDSSRIRLVPV